MPIGYVEPEGIFQGCPRNIRRLCSKWFNLVSLSPEPDYMKLAIIIAKLNRISKRKGYTIQSQTTIYSYLTVHRLKVMKDYVVFCNLSVPKGSKGDSNE